MSLRNTRAKWGWPTKLLHWVMAVLMIGLALVGTWMANFVNDMVLQFQVTQYHKSFGVVVFGLAILRVLWRLLNPVSPAHAAGRSAWERRAASMAHGALYALMFVMPLSGWLMASASALNDPGAYPMQVKNMVFGLFELPDPISPGDESLEAIFHTVHAWSSYLLAVVLLLHIGGALKHHFRDRDDTLRRMLP